MRHRRLIPTVQFSCVYLIIAISQTKDPFAAVMRDTFWLIVQVPARQEITQRTANYEFSFWRNERGATTSRKLIARILSASSFAEKGRNRTRRRRTQQFYRGGSTVRARDSLRH